jgi:hypothetical protein
MTERSLSEIAREIAEEGVCTAVCAGYEIRRDRELFSRSDLLDLADDIAHWLERHMVVRHEDAEP